MSRTLEFCIAVLLIVAGLAGLVFLITQNLPPDTF